MKDKFLTVCPYGEQYLGKLVLKCEIRIWVLFALATVLLVVWNRMYVSFSNLYLLESIFLAFYLICTEVPNYQLQVKENRVYHELLLYFSRVKHRYMASRHMANSVWDAAVGMSYEMQRLSSEIYRVLLECDRKEKVRNYILHNKTNRYLKLFLIQAYEASEKGDVFFAENMEYLRLELMDEIYRRKRRSHEFAGYVFVTVTPFFLMPVLRHWGIEFTPDLGVFYAGTGIILETITFVATILVYGMILRAKELVFFTPEPECKLWNTEWFFGNGLSSAVIKRLESKDGTISMAIRKLILKSGTKKRFGKVCFQMFAIAIGSFFLLSVFCIRVHGEERKAILENVDSIERIAPIAGEEKQRILAGQILEITKQCIGQADIVEEEILYMLRKKVLLGNETMEQAAVQEIMKKLEQYNETKVSFREVLICAALSVCVGFIPIFTMHYQTKTILSGAVYEVRQFQSIILMERKLHGITIVELLEDMEVFSRCFRESLRRCINSYSSGATRALLQLKEEGGRLHDGFEELADAFLSVDEVGIEQAFAEVESNRRLLEKMTQLEAEISLERKKDSTDLLAKIPLILTVGVYFILPFFLYSLRGVQEVFIFLEEMNF